MAIQLTTPKQEIEKHIIQQTQRLKDAVVYNLLYVGEQVVNHARNLPSPSAEIYDKIPHQPNYIDRTANLRSSIGYVVSIDGDIVKAGGFEPVSGGAEGTESGRRYAQRIAGELNSGIALIVVAGMRYARYVTAKGYDVLDSAELLAERLIPQMLKQLDIN